MEIINIRNKKYYSQINLYDSYTVYSFIGDNLQDVVSKTVKAVYDNGYSFLDKNFKDLLMIYNSLDYKSTIRTKKCLNSILKEFSFC